jgi:hypothetical protein
MSAPIGKVDLNRYGTSRPKLEQDDFEGDFTIVTIATVEEAEVDDDEKEGGKRQSLVLTFNETGDKSLWLNVTQLKHLIAQMGDDARKWLGQKIPVEKVKASFKGKSFDKVYVMDADGWDNAFKAAKVKRTAASIGKAGAKR